MSALRIGYWPLTKSMDSAGDRRRLVFWAKARGHTLTSNLNEKVDVIVASENADFNSSFFANENIPVVFDLVDAYLSPLNMIDDSARGIAKKLSGQITGGLKPFSHHVRDFCTRSSLVICSSIEQESVINQFNLNTRVILDCHEEIPFINPSQNSIRSEKPNQILWEGQPATIRGVAQISSVLTSLSKDNDLQFNFITDQKYFRLLNRYFERSTLGLLEKDLHQISHLIQITPWTPSNLVETAKKSSVAMIPIDLSVPMQLLKPENRLLIMWRLGLPCLTSPSPAYIRVASKAGVNAACENLQDWTFNFERILNDTNFARSESVKGQNYLHEFHTREILLQKWDEAFEAVLG